MRDMRRLEHLLVSPRWLTLNELSLIDPAQLYYVPYVPYVFYAPQVWPLVTVPARQLDFVYRIARSLTCAPLRIYQAIEIIHR